MRKRFLKLLVLGIILLFYGCDGSDDNSFTTPKNRQEIYKDNRIISVVSNSNILPLYGVNLASEGQIHSVKYSVIPDNNEYVECYSGDNSIIEIVSNIDRECKFKVKKTGEGYIGLKLLDNSEIVEFVYVSITDNIEDFILESSGIVLDKDDKNEDTYQIKPSLYNQTDFSYFQYESEDENIATVSDTGMVKAINVGKTNINVYSTVKGKKYMASMSVEVYSSIPTSISLDYTSITTRSVSVGTDIVLTSFVKVEPDNRALKHVKYKLCSGADYAKIVNGSILHTDTYYPYANDIIEPIKVMAYSDIDDKIVSYGDFYIYPQTVVSNGKVTFFTDKFLRLYGVGVVDTGLIVVDEKISKPRTPIIDIARQIAYLGGKKIKKVSIIHNTVYALTVDGDLYVWGENRNLTLPLPKDYSEDKFFIKYPIKLDFKDNKIIEFAVSKSLESSDSLAITYDGNWIYWGNNSKGDFNFFTKNQKNKPMVIYGDSNCARNVVEANNTFFVTYTNGYYDFVGSKGTNDYKSGKGGSHGTMRRSFYANAYRLSSFGNFAIDRRGAVFFVGGDNRYGDLLGKNFSGAEYKLYHRNVSMQLMYEGKPFFAIPNGFAIGNKTFFAISNKGSLIGWGNNEEGQLGIGYITLKEDKALLIGDKDFQKEKITEVTITNGDNVFSVTKSGKIYAWGSNLNNYLGLKEKDIVVATPKEVKSYDEYSGNPKNISFYTVKAQQGSGYGSFFTISVNGDIYAWGNNNNGQLSIGSRKNQDTPEKIRMWSF